MRTIIQFFFILFFFFNFTYALSQCNFSTINFLDKINDPKYLKELQVIANNNKSWTINLLDAYLFSNNKQFIEKKYKKKFNAKVKVIYDFGECEYNSTIRITGDLNDHIYKNKLGNIFPSIKVRLLNGNILNAVGFKLFLPKAKKNENEVITTKILNELNILSPQTFFIDTKINNLKQKYIFQEEARKELLEKNDRNEGFIFEGDENYLVNYKGFKNFQLWNISLSRIINKRFAISKGDINYNNNLRAFTILQNVFLKNRYFAESKLDRYFLNFPSEFKKGNKFEIYDLLMISTNSLHGLIPHNRKFYFDTINDKFEPIYYDGDTNLNKIDPNFIKNNKIILQLINSIDLKNYNYLQNKIKNLKNEELFFEELKDQIKYKKISKKNLNKYFEIIEGNLEIIKNFHKQNKNSNQKNNKISLYQNRYLDRLESFKINTHIYEINKYNTSTNNYTLNCLYPKNCLTKIYNKEEILDILSAKNKENKEIILGLDFKNLNKF